jgi:oligoendopeptidase F
MQFNKIQNKLFSDSGNGALPTRDKVEEKYKWDLTHIYATDEKWEEDFKWVEENIKVYEKYEGKISTDIGLLAECLKFDDSIGIKLDRLHLYASLSKDSDMRVNNYQALNERIRSLASKASSASSFIRPEILSIPGDELLKSAGQNEELKIYKHLLEDIIRTKSHTLSKQEEEILALAGETSQIPYNAFSIFTNADIKFPVIKDENGNDFEISHARYYSAMYSLDRAFRQRAYSNYYKQFIDYSNTFSVLFNGNLKIHIFNAKARKYGSSREAALNVNNIPVSVYDNLIKTVNENLKPLHRWALLKKKILKIDELHPYDLYVPLFQTSAERKYSFDEAVEIVYKALEPLGKDYLDTLRMAFENRWVDVYETQAKRSGAYSSGTTFGMHPYVLLNWTGMLNDVFTLAHEMGHNMHSYYTGLNQPYPYANYSIFLAEVASTFNESLLLDYLIKNSSSKTEKLDLIEKYLNNITATFYRQAMFAEFESLVYEKTENGAALTSDVLCDFYKEIYQKYWGPEMIIDEEEEYTWARVPHFYYNFYVYQYATGFAASEVLTKKVKEEDGAAVKKYLGFLKAGSSDYPIEILKSAGVDMNSSEPVIAITRKMTELLDEVDVLINQ